MLLVKESLYSPKLSSITYVFYAIHHCGAVNFCLGCPSAFSTKQSFLVLVLTSAYYNIN
jgi:hypothetical protein